MSLYPVAPVVKSDPQDVNQLVNLCNGTDTATALLVSNRIQASTPGASVASAYIGGTFTLGDKNKNKPRTQANAPSKAAPPVSGSFLAGDFACDEAGLFWLSTAATSGTTPWISIGQGGSPMYTRQYATSRGDLPGDVLYGAVSHGDLQYSNWSARKTFGFRIPTTGYYELTSGMHVHGDDFDATSSFGYGWASVAAGAEFGPSDPKSGRFGDIANLRTLGDFIKGGSSNTKDGGGMTEDILSFTAGDRLAPYLLYYGGESDQGASDITISTCIYLTLKFYSAAPSA